ALNPRPKPYTSHRTCLWLTSWGFSHWGPISGESIHLGLMSWGLVTHFIAAVLGTCRAGRTVR
ncbi:MAG: hypothetical protein ACK55Z_01640, partial [bacterium]